MRDISFANAEEQKRIALAVMPASELATEISGAITAAAAAGELSVLVTLKTIKPKRGDFSRPTGTTLTKKEQEFFENLGYGLSYDPQRFVYTISWK